MKKPATDNRKVIKLGTALTFTFVALLVGFLGGVVFSAFRMQNTLPPSSMVASSEEQPAPVISPEQEKQLLAMEKKVSESPKDVNTWIALGNAYFDLRQPDKAIHAYETALKYDPANADVWTDLGVMYRQIDKPEEAIDAFDKANAFDPKHEASLFNKGIVQMHDLNDPEGAAETWGKLVKLNPSATTQSGMLVKDLIDKLKSPAPAKPE